MVGGRSHLARRAAALCLAMLFAGLAPGRSPAAASPTLRVGQITLERCGRRAPWCAYLKRALDPRGAVPGDLAVYFEYYPHTGAVPAVGTLVATEGGPGYPATGSREEYLALFGPLRADHDVLIMDNRGTGRSGALDCPPLQQAAVLTEAGIGACGRALGAAAPLYSTALAADDLAALLDALGVTRVDLYGDSYGTYFAQVFALRHPARLRSLILDGAYPLEGPDYPWYPHYAPAMRDKFNRACERDPGCRALGGNSLAHIAPALEQLRRQPFDAAAHTGAGQERRFKANASQLAIVMLGGSPAYATLRETDAAARAFVAGDQLPLLRLMAEALNDTDSRDASRAPRKFSAALAAAVFCQDPPQIFDMHLAPVARLAARDAALVRRRAQAPDTYAPFTIDEYRGMPLDYAFIDECVLWPALAPDNAAVPLLPPAAAYPDVPVLVISGEFDNMTSVADGEAAAAHYPHAHHVVLANSFHVNALPHARSECGALLARRFLVELATGDEACAAAVPELRLVPRFARTTTELPPADALPGNEGGEELLRLARAALLTAGDVIARAQANGSGRGVGLRGGRYTVRDAGPGYRLHLSAVRWSEDAPFSGEIQWPGRSGRVRGELTLHGAKGARGRLQLEWQEGASGARAALAGSLDGRAVHAEAPAP